MPQVLGAPPLPIVTDVTMLRSLRDLILDVGEDGKSNGLTDQIQAIRDQNPAILKAVEMMAEDESEEFRFGALMGLAIAYRLVNAQMELAALERMAGLEAGEPRCTSCGLPLAHFAGPEKGNHGMICLTPGCDLNDCELRGDE